jgi:hypothetical protein
MKPDAYLWQLTLNTGYSERRYRHDVEDHEFDAIRAMNPLKDGLVHIPAVGDADYYLQTRIDHAQEPLPLQFWRKHQSPCPNRWTRRLSPASWRTVNRTTPLGE